MTSVERGGGEVFKFVTCLHTLLFLYSRSVVLFGGGGGGGGGVGVWTS